MVTIAPPAPTLEKSTRKKTRTQSKSGKDAEALTAYAELKASQQQSGDYSDMRLKKGLTVWLDMKLEGDEKAAASGQAYVSIGRCSVVDPEPLMYCPIKEGGANVVANRHDYTTVTCEQHTTEDIGWLDSILGHLDVFYPVGTKDLRCGYPEITNPEERKIKNMFKAATEWTGASGVVRMRKQVTCFFSCFFVVSCLI
jgi:hypothetical protein